MAKKIPVIGGKFRRLAGQRQYPGGVIPAFAGMTISFNRNTF
jgi:hypothetical protein